MRIISTLPNHSIFKKPLCLHNRVQGTLHITDSSNKGKLQRHERDEHFLDTGRRTFIEKSTFTFLCTLESNRRFSACHAAQSVISDWDRVALPIADDILLLDIGFVDSKKGYLLGTRRTLLETDDSGKTWKVRQDIIREDDEINYRFNSVSFAGDEGWIVGKPTILLHTMDAGRTWERVPLSAKLPGTPLKITATGTGQAEMITDQGAIYVTSNSASSWQAAVQETVDATLNRTVSSGISGASYFEGYFSNINRAQDGQYVAVSSRGNFFMTWAPGDSSWMPHNRPTGRRIQNMGWGPYNKLWMTTRGGEVLFGETEGITEDFASIPLQSRGFGILDVGFSTERTGYACGGSGSLYRTEDGGTTWKREKSANDLAGNLYAVKFFFEQGFILGNGAILLRCGRAV